MKVSRVEQSGTFMMACLEGEGQVLADGRWQTIRVGSGLFITALCDECIQEI
ncbi:hypothetical protein [Rubritalea tangerina]|uniref:hypothetical protein n=1 Tax=Rubritalea tangerina TaxID=430798 RepID=UPI00360E4BBD